MTGFQEQIEGDLTWREAEMGSLKLLLASADRGSDRYRALLRACCAMLYAHYEGFCKFCWILLLETVEADARPRSDLIEPLAKLSMAPVFKTLRGNTSDEALWRFCAAEFQTELRNTATFSQDVDTQSNLWPDLSKALNDSVGLDCPLLLAHSAQIEQLVARRNKIAHGEKMEINSIEQFQQLEHAAWVVMHELAIAVTDCLVCNAHLRCSVDPATLI